MNQYSLKLEEIKAEGNFKPLIEVLEERMQEALDLPDDDSRKTSAIAKGIKTIYGELGIAYSLCEGLESGQVWNEREAVLCLLATHLICIRGNSAAHRILNGIEPKSDIENLYEYVEDKKREGHPVYSNITIIK